MTDDAIRADIHRKAAAHAEATVYSMNNNYLTRTEKAQVEAVYQFSFGVFTYAFAYFALVGGYTFWLSFGYAAAVGSGAWLMSRVIMSPAYMYPAFVLAGWGGTIIQLLIAGYALYRHRWGVAAFVGLEAFGLMAAFIPSMWLWTAFFGGRMNPKYRIAKQMFGIEFPFERDLAAR